MSIHSLSYFDLNTRHRVPAKRMRYVVHKPLLHRIAGWMLIAVLTCVLFSLLRVVVLDWWRARTPLVSAVGTTIMPPVNSDLNDALVDWTIKHGAANRPFAEFVVKTTFEEAIRRQIDPWTMLALISVESRFDPMATSGAGAMGLTQIIPMWHPEKVNIIHIYDPATNIRVGVQILREYKDRQNGDMTRALLQYNGSLLVPRAYAVRVWAARTELVTYSMARIIRGSNDRRD